MAILELSKAEIIIGKKFEHQSYSLKKFEFY